MYEDLERMRECLNNIGKNIERCGLPEKFSPMVFAYTGTGRVAMGVEEMLEILPHLKVDPDELKDYMKGGEKHALAENKIIIS